MMPICGITHKVKAVGKPTYLTCISRLMPSKGVFVFFILLFQFLFVSVSYSETLSFSFTDPVGDAFLFPGETGPATDVLGLFFTFESDTGAYEITMTSSADNPFIGDVRINVNLFNPDTGTTALNPSFFQDVVNDFSLTTPSTTITLTGSNPNLLAWEAGDRVAACAGPGGIIPEACSASLGHPDGISAFSTGVINTEFGVPFVNIARDAFQDPPTATITSVASVPLDIKPGSCPNPINTVSEGVVPVAILGGGIDITNIDVASVRLEGVIPIRSAMEDVTTPFPGDITGQSTDCWSVGADGFMDLVLKFDTQELVDALGEVLDGEVRVLNLTGVLQDGTPIQGSDVVILKKKKRNDQ